MRGVSQTKALAHHIHFFRARLCQTRRGATRIVRHHALLQRFVPLYDFSKRLAKGNAFCKYVANLARSCGPQFSESFKQANRGRYLFFPAQSFDTTPSNIRPNSPGATTAVSSNKPNLASQPYRQTDRSSYCCLAGNGYAP